MGIVEAIMTLVGVVVGTLAPVAPGTPADEVKGVVVEASTVTNAVADEPVALAPHRAEDRGAIALAAMPVSVGSLGYTISFHERAAPGGLLWPDRRHIEIFVSPDQPDSLLRHIIAHEIGHAVDLELNSRSDHDAWRQARGIGAAVPWWAGPYEQDFATPGGDFAECFAHWAAGTPSRSAFGSCAGTEPLMARLTAG